MVSRFTVAFALYAAVNAAVFCMPCGKPTEREIESENFTLDVKVAQEGKPSSWWLARAYLKDIGRPDVVVCGSSQIGGLQAADANRLNAPIDFVKDHHCRSIEMHLAEKQAQTSPYVFLCALPGAMISDHFAIARALYQAKGAPEAVVLTVSPRDFIDNSLPCAGSTEPYKYFSQFSDMGKYKALAYNEPWQAFQYAVSEELPLRHLAAFLKEKENQYKALAVGSDSTAAGAVASGAASTVDGADAASSSSKNGAATIADQVKFVMGGYEGNIKPGQAVLTPNLPPIFVDNSRDYRRRYKNSHPATYDVQMQYFREFLAYLNSEKTKVIVLGMPLTKENRAVLPDSFWRKYRADMQALCTAGNATWVDLISDPDFSRNDFCDTVHLNGTGGEKLASKIAESLNSQSIAWRKNNQAM